MKNIVSEAEFVVENVGGIETTELTIEPGVTVLSGENATNRTSFLQAIMAAMGSTRATLKGDAEEGRVRLSIAGETYERQLSRAGDKVQFGGEAYLDNPDVADLFAFLLETNEARRAVISGDDLRELIMRPVDTDAIEADIRRLEDEKDRLNEELSTIEARKRDLPDLEQQRNSLREQIAEKRERLTDIEAEIDENSNDVEESQQERDALEDRLAELRETRSELETLREKIDSREKSIRSLKQERSELQAERADLPETQQARIDHLDDEVSRLRTRQQSLNSEISDLQSLIQYNEERVDADKHAFLDEMDVDSTGDAESVTGQLLNTESQSVVCWTCGSTVDRSQITDTIDRLRSLREEKLSTLSTVKDDLESSKEEQREIERRERRRAEIEQKLEGIEDELTQRTTQLDSLRERREELTTDVKRLESAVEELESADFEDILSLHREANQLEFDIDSLESELEAVTDEISEVEALVDRADELRDERATVAETLTDKRTKVTQIETDAVEAFNEHMEAVLDVLEYENIDRVWIERTERQVRDGRRTVEKTTFELHVVRTTENGAAYEDTVNHLSESEREVVGLVFALAGYLVHDLHETVPFMLLDSLEAIDADRIAALVEYFADTSEYLVIALLSEDAAALSDEYTYVTTI